MTRSAYWLCYAPTNAMNGGVDAPVKRLVQRLSDANS